MMSQVSHGAVQFMVYEELKAVASGVRLGESLRIPLIHHSPSDRKLTPPEILVFGAVSKLTASLITYPSQVCCIVPNCDPTTNS